MVEKLRPVSEIRRRALGAEITGQLQFTWSRLSAPWRVGCVLGVMAVIGAIVAGAILLASSKDWGAKLAGIAGGIALLYAGYQVRVTRSLAKQNLAYAYFERFSRYSLEEPYAVAKAFAFPHPRDQAEATARWDEFQAWEQDDPKKFRDLIFIFNFFEELGSLYNDGAVDRRIVNDYLGKFALQFWDSLDWFIVRFRGAHSSTQFEDWEAMSKLVKRALRRKERLR
jgi:hypothetical protein